MRALTHDPRSPIPDNRIWFDEEPIPFDTAMAEFMMMGLRLKEGISAENFERLFDCSIHQKYGPVLSRFEKNGWMNEGGRRLTAQGQLFANQIVSAMLP